MKNTVQHVWLAETTERAITKLHTERACTTQTRCTYTYVYTKLIHIIIYCCATIILWIGWLWITLAKWNCSCSVHSLLWGYIVSTSFYRQSYIQVLPWHEFINGRYNSWGIWQWNWRTVYQVPYVHCPTTNVEAAGMHFVTKSYKNVSKDWVDCANSALEQHAWVYRHPV